MCTAVSWNAGRHYFGRNLDLEYAYREQVVVTPRNYPFHFRCGHALEHHHAMIGMATVSMGYPLYYEATNECGLSMAGLSFAGYAVYQYKKSSVDNLAPFELIPWILGQCSSVSQARQLLQDISVWAMPFSRELHLSALHWLISDQNNSIVAEPLADGLHIHDDPVGILTNAPPFPYHMIHLTDYMQLQPGQADNRLPGVVLKPYSNGMGALGLPGDLSSASRFVKAAFVKCNSVCDGDEVSQFFHILRSVEMSCGSVRIRQRNEITRYSSCCDTAQGIYYYTTYDNSRPRAVRLQNTPLDAKELTCYDLLDRPDVFWQN